MFVHVRNYVVCIVGVSFILFFLHAFAIASFALLVFSFIVECLHIFIVQASFYHCVLL